MATFVVCAGGYEGEVRRTLLKTSRNKTLVSRLDGMKNLKNLEPSSSSVKTCKLYYIVLSAETTFIRTVAHDMHVRHVTLTYSIHGYNVVARGSRFSQKEAHGAFGDQTQLLRSSTCPRLSPVLLRRRRSRAPLRVASVVAVPRRALVTKKRKPPPRRQRKVQYDYLQLSGLG